MDITAEGYFLELATSLLGGVGLQGDMLKLLATASVVTAILIVAWLVFWVLTSYVVPAVLKIAKYTTAKWDDILLNPRLLRVVAELVTVILLASLLPPALEYYETLRGVTEVAFKVLEVAVMVHLVNRFILALYQLLEENSSGRVTSLKGIRQMLQVIAVSVGVIIVISILAQKNPLTVITGLGAAATVLMLVFKDSIMGMVAGVQLTLNDMLRPGDWITVPARNINGTVLEVGLTTVKVQNFDMTIVTVPPYSLVSESFQNWRGMADSRGRRINRSVTIDLNTVAFCTREMLEEFRNEEWGGDIDPEGRYVNLTLYRRYLEHYISTLPQLKTGPDMIYMVRELQPTPQGVPLDLYLFTSLTSWKPYEHLQAEVMDHVFASVGRFGLRVYQAPSGLDLRAVAPGAMLPG